MGVWPQNTRLTQLSNTFRRRRRLLSSRQMKSTTAQHLSVPLRAFFLSTVQLPVRMVDPPLHKSTILLGS